MKNIILLFSFLGLTVFTNAQSLKPIYAAIGAGNADALGAHLNSDLELCFFDQEDIFSKAEAIEKLKTFFSSKSPKGISEIHKSSATGKGSFFTISNLKTSEGPLRVYIYVRKDGEQVIIEELRFDKAS
jgi:hypothetical protein